MTVDARGRCHLGVLVHRMAVETAPPASMFGRVVVVTSRAGRRIERLHRVGAMALTARLIAVALALVAASTVVGTHGAVGPEAVTALAGDRRGVGGVKGDGLGAVTLLADIRGRRSEGPIAVAITAGHAMRRDVNRVPCALADRIPDRGHDIRRTRRPTAAARDQEHDHEPPHRDPTGWQSRHGIALSGCGLDQPGG